MKSLPDHGLEGALVIVLVATLSLPVISTAEAADLAPLSAKVTNVVGSARYEDKNHRTWTELRAGVVLAADPVLQTDLKASTADIELTGSDTGGRAAVHMFSNIVLRQVGLSAKKSRAVEARDVVLDVAAGQVRISVDGISEYGFTLSGGSSSTRVTIPRSVPGPEETIFVFNGALTVLKGAVTADTRTGGGKVIHAGEQLRSDSDEVKKLPPDAPELKLGP